MASLDLAILSERVQKLHEDMVLLQKQEINDKKVFELRQRLTSTASEILAADSDPTQRVKDIGRGYTASVALKICLDLDLVHKFPEDESHVELSALAAQVGADEGVLGAILGLLSNKGLFKRHGPSAWGHSDMSVTLLKGPFNDLMSSLLDESFKSCITLPDTLRESGYRVPTPGHTAFNMYYQTELDFYRYCATQDTATGSRFSRAMEQVASASLHFFEAAYPLQRLASSMLIIDVAGGIGIASIFLAEKLPKQRFLVTDYQSVIEQGKATCPAHLRARVQYVAHDMFEPYHNLGFEKNSERVFLLKQILHDWSDDQCVTILSNILDCFGPSDRLLIIDSVKPVEGTGLSTAMSEIMVMSTFGGRHRNYAEFQTLVCAARSNALVQTSFANAGQYDDFLVLEVRVGDNER
ncbi:unnamed protein product [Alternaria alternata]